MSKLRPVALAVSLVLISSVGIAASAAEPTAAPVATTSPTATPTVPPTVPPPVPPTTTPTPTPTEPPVEPPVEPPATHTWKWQPKPGVIFNEPRRAKRSHVINSTIRKAVQNTQPGDKIRMVTWNFSSGVFAGVLRRAHQRGVSVRIVMANGLAKRQSRNGPYAHTKRVLEAGNAKRPATMASWFRVCKNSCRGVEGIQHGKWFMFSRTAGKRKVVMSTSANLTDAAAVNQWNDLLTVVNRKVTWREYNRMFKKMGKDKPDRPFFRTFQDGRYQGWFFPQMGAAKNYNALHLLNRVRCRGARNAGINGRTVIKVSQAVFNGKPGTLIAGKLKGLQNRGCRVKMVYGVLNRGSAARLAGIPKREILEDTNGDGFVDRYLHMKAMTISGVVGKKRSAHVTYQGSANWSGMSTLSDEQGFIVTGKKLEKKYSRFIDYLFKNCPPQGQNLVKFIDLRTPLPDGDPTVLSGARAPHDPFALVRAEMGMGDMTPSR